MQVNGIDKRGSEVGIMMISKWFRNHPHTFTDQWSPRRTALCCRPAAVRGQQLSEIVDHLAFVHDQCDRTIGIEELQLVLEEHLGRRLSLRGVVAGDHVFL